MKITYIAALSAPHDSLNAYAVVVEAGGPESAPLERANQLASAYWLEVLTSEYPGFDAEGFNAFESDGHVVCAVRGDVADAIESCEAVIREADCDS